MADADALSVATSTRLSPRHNRPVAFDRALSRGLRISLTALACRGRWTSGHCRNQGDASGRTGPRRACEVTAGP